MENGHLHDDKLFRAVHDRLSDYEAPSNGADWDAMSRALDNLPKNAGFKMKFSLNSILVIVGLVGVSALSFALVTNKGNSPEAKTNSHAVVTPDSYREKTNPVVPVNNTQPASQNTFASSNEMGFTANASAVTTETTTTTAAKTDVASTNSALNPDGSVKKRRNKNQLVFGDQIDPKKGFIYSTKENANVLNQPVDQAPNVFYDYENGQLRTIKIKDSTTSRVPHKPKADSTATNFTPGVPTEGGPTGFDMED